MGRRETCVLPRVVLSICFFFRFHCAEMQNVFQQPCGLVSWSELCACWMSSCPCWCCSCTLIVLLSVHLRLLFSSKSCNGCLGFWNEPVLAWMLFGASCVQNNTKVLVSEPADYLVNVAGTTYLQDGKKPSSQLLIMDPGDAVNDQTLHCQG